MIQINDWMDQLMEGLQSHFLHRLLFVGLQGSYRRNEANPNSDIDAVVILDAVSLDDLKVYRTILSAMPENDKACGFISGKRELENWPKYELFQFVHDTLPLYGKLEDLLPPIEQNDITISVKNMAAGLYHTCCHTIVHNPANIEAVKGAYKSAFFLLQALYYLRTGEYASTKKALLPLLREAEREILIISMDWSKCVDDVIKKPDEYIELLMRWCANILVQTVPPAIAG